MSMPTNLYHRLALGRASSQALQSYFESHSIRKLQLGTGINKLEGWFNTDITPSSPEVFFLDSTKTFPFEDTTFHYIFSEHHFEHITYDEGSQTLRECYRVLLPGGKIRIATPNLAALIGLYTPTPNRLQQHYIRFITDAFLPMARGYTPAFVINNAFRNWGHQFLYDQATLQTAMEDAGFVDITPVTPGESTDEHLHNIEKHGEFIGDEAINKFETMVLEGSVPSLKKNFHQERSLYENGLEHCLPSIFHPQSGMGKDEKR